VRAARLRFPSLALEQLEQRYRRLDGTTYRYESGGDIFVAGDNQGPGGALLTKSSPLQSSRIASDRPVPRASVSYRG
jgi:hypothetical protein